MDAIAPGVYALPLAFEPGEDAPLMYPAAVETDRGLVLVDTGFADHLDAVESHLAEAGFGLDDVALVVVTHQDADHAGGLAALADRTDVTTLAHADEAPYIARERPLLKDREYPPARVDVELVDGVAFRTAAGEMRVVATPGHSPGHVSLYLPGERLLLAADAITAEEAFDGPNEAATPDMDAATDSVGRLAELAVERTLCFHGGLVEHDRDQLGRIHADLAASGYGT
jgi:glyoxylase-like metal-dependent hydrolase (beta-lactamase superfamily II)